jgi:hypothetical protein
VIHTPDVPPRSKRKQSKRAKASGSSMKTPGSRMEVMVEQILIKLTNHIDTSISKHMDKFADVSAQVTWTIFCMLLSAEMHLYTA